MVSKLKYGNTNTFLIRGTRDSLLIDTGYAGTLPAFYKAIKEHGIKISDIIYVLATHYPPDHMGLISEHMEQGVQLVLIDTQVEHIHFSGEIFRKDGRIEYVSINKEKADILKCEDSIPFLHSMGIEGEVISTPSHSADSISLILDDGTCILADLEPIDYLDAYDDNVALKEDWELILSYEPQMFLYAHANERVIS